MIWILKDIFLFIIIYFSPSFPFLRKLREFTDSSHISATTASYHLLLTEDMEHVEVV